MIIMKKPSKKNNAKSDPKISQNSLLKVGENIGLLKSKPKTHN